MSSSPVLIPNKLYFRIGDVADLIGVKPYVLRYWETEFSVISPQKSASGQRVYRRVDVETLVMIKHLLHVERYSIEGARKRIRELRREGQLGDFRRGKAGPSESATSSADTAASHTASQMGLKTDLEQLLALGRELQSLAQMPIDALFKY